MIYLDAGSCQQPSENHMQPSHPSTLKFLNSGIFDDLKCFPDLEKRIAELEGTTEKGDAFEIFVEGYIATHKLASAYRRRPPPRTRFRTPGHGSSPALGIPASPIKSPSAGAGTWSVRVRDSNTEATASM
jgi:hypothetical protein